MKFSQTKYLQHCEVGVGIGSTLLTQCASDMFIGFTESHIGIKVVAASHDDNDRELHRP